MQDWRAVVGRNVRKIRQQRRMTQEKLAFEAEIDLTYVGGIERGKRNLSLPTTHLNRAFTRLDDLEAKRAKAIEQFETERADIEKKLPPSLVAGSKMPAAGKQFCEAISSHAKAIGA